MTFQIGEDIVSGASYVLAAASELVKPLSRVETSLQGRVWKCSRWRMGLRSGAGAGRHAEEASGWADRRSVCCWRVQGLFLGLRKRSPSTMPVVAQLCEYTENHQLLYFKWVHCMVYEFYLNKTII